MPMMAKPAAILTPVVIRVVSSRAGTGRIIGSGNIRSKLRGSAVALAGEKIGGQRRHAIQEEQPVEMVDLVLQRARFECVGGDLPLRSLGRPPAHRDRE